MTDQENTLRITKMARQAKGYVTARVTSQDRTYEVHNRYGSWMCDLNDGSGATRGVLVPVAVKLNERLRAFERGEAIDG